jgi:hypothetical protein
MKFQEPLCPRFTVVQHLELCLDGGERRYIFNPTKEDLAATTGFGIMYHAGPLEKICVDWSARKIRGTVRRTVFFNGGNERVTERRVRHFTFEAAEQFLEIDN